MASTPYLYNEHFLRDVRTRLSGADSAPDVTRFISQHADETLQFHLKETLETVGTPPCNWALVLFGSEGRGEQTLKTDQDNALILDEKALNNPGVISWFTDFGQTINQKMNDAGYAFCKGGIMAGNPTWCLPLSVWKKQFRSWIRHPEPLAVMQSSIFFDLRHGAGSPGLTQSLRTHLDTLLSEQAEVFFYHMVQNSLKIQVPPGMLRRLWLRFYPTPDLKHLSLPIIELARILALQNNLHATNTGDRLIQLREQGILDASKADQLTQAFNQLTYFRISRQLHALQEHHPPGNTLRYAALTVAEKDIFNQAMEGVLLARLILRNTIGAYF